MARALASARRSETALLRARGAAERQLTGLGVAESALVIAPAVVAGPLLGSWLAHGVASGWPAPLHAASPGGVGLGLWLAAVVAAAAAVPVLLLPSAGSALAAASAATLGGRQRNLGTISRAGADLALVALAGVACWQVATTSHALNVTASGRLSVDPVLLVAPVLAGPACAVLILRLLPLASRLADAAARAGRRAVLPLASWSVSRRPLQLAGPLLMTVLSLATVVLALSQNQASQQSARDQAAFEAGADYRADLPFGPLAPGQVTRMTRLAGVTAALPAVRAADLVVGGSQATVTVVGLPAAQAGNVVLLRRDGPGGGRHGAPGTAGTDLRDRRHPPGGRRRGPGRPQRHRPAHAVGPAGGRGRAVLRDQPGHPARRRPPAHADGQPGRGPAGRLPAAAGRDRAVVRGPNPARDRRAHRGHGPGDEYGCRAVPGGFRTGAARAARPHHPVPGRAERHPGRRGQHGDQLAAPVRDAARAGHQLVPGSGGPARRLGDHRAGQQHPGPDAGGRHRV
jgi:hypothetical protein